MCVLSDHQPANHQEFELSVTEETTVNTGKSKEHCAQGIKSEFKDARTQRISPDSNTVMFDRQNEHCAQPVISEFEDARTQRISPDSNTVMFERQNEHGAQANISEFEDARTQRIIPDSDTVMFEGQNEHCAQSIISEFDDARTQKFSSELNTVVIKAEIHAENTDAQHIVHFEEAQALLGYRFLDHAGTTVTVHTRHDQRAIVVGVCDTTKRIMVPGRVDRRLPHRFSGRPRGGRQCHITTKL